MNSIIRITSKGLPFSNYLVRRSISLSSVSQLKEIREIKTEKALVIEGVTIPSSRENLLYKPPCFDKGACSLCAAGLDVKHTDVLILSQFVRSDGCMLPKRITGLCNTQQRKIATMVAMAQKAGLMPNLAPASSKKDPKQRYQWKKFNKYFDESTIKLPSNRKQ